MSVILVPTDFSENAENALFYAIELAKKEKAKIILLNAFTISEEDFAGNTEKAKERSEKQLKSLTVKIKHAGGIEYKCVSLEGNAEKIILDFAKNNPVDFIVMGTQGESNLSKVIFGSNTAHVVSKASCPIIAVPEGVKNFSIKKITYATDYHNSDIEALKKVEAFAKPYHAQINILHIANEKESPVEEKKLMEKFKIQVEKTLGYNNISFQMLAGKNTVTELKEYLESGSADLLVMATHHRGMWEKIFGASLTNEMAYISPVPLMAFHYNNNAAVKLI